MKINNPSRLRDRKPLAIGLGLFALLLLAAVWLQYNLATHQRQAEVASRGAQVMPFDLEKTTHRFEPLVDGGLQTVVADNPTDRVQIELIQTHLQAETIKFQAGDFSDPAAIHGDRMPGLAALKAGYRQIDIQYTALPNGGQIRYTTRQTALLSAVHDWFAAQRSDHGHHAAD